MASMGTFNNQRVSPHQSIRVTATTNLDAADPGASKASTSMGADFCACFSYSIDKRAYNPFATHINQHIYKHMY